MLDVNRQQNEKFLEYLTRIDVAVDIALRYGSVDGGHHKMWVIDQMVRALKRDNYEMWVKLFNSDEEYADWDVGIAP